MTAIGDEVLEGVSIDTAIMFNFTDTFNISNIEPNVKLTLDGKTDAITGTWSSEMNETNLFTFTPGAALDYEMTYNITIGAGLQNLTGVAWYYDMAKTFQFLTEGLGAFPVSGKVVDQDGDPVKGIKVVVVSTDKVTYPDGKFNATTGDDGKFTIADVPAGTVAIEAQDLYYGNYVQYDATGATNASVKIEAAVTIADLMVTEADLPVTVTPAPGTTNVKIKDLEIVIVYPEAMDVNKTKAGFSLSKNGNLITGTWNVTTGNTTFKYKSDNLLDPNTTYEIDIAASIRTAEDKPLFWKAWNSNFTTEEAPKEKLTAKIKVGGVEYTGTMLEDIALTASITVEFSLKMNKATIEGNVSVTPSGGTAIAVTYAWSNEDKILTIDPTSDLTKGTTYTVNVAMDVMSMTGMKLEKALTATFKTVLPAIVITLYIDGEGSVALEKDGTQVATGNIVSNVVTLSIPGDQFTSGTHTVKVTGKDDYKDDEWTIEIDEDGIVTGPGDSADNARAMEKEGTDDDDGNMMMIIAIVVIIVIIIVVMVMLAMRKKPAEEEAPVEEEEETAGEFECPACGALVSADEKVCPECGEEFEEEEFKCPECGAPIEPDATTCEACGAEFELEEEGEEGEEGMEGEEEEEEDYEVEDEEGEEDLEGEEELDEEELEEEDLEADEELEEDLVEEDDLDELDDEVDDEDLDEELDKVE
jgi:RNA polymerase subunit RPABC4/transcription elongation factor Spt4